jgi:RNA polymerase sigma-70 factor (ECF subfamily)
MDELFPLTDLLVLRAQAGDREAFATLAALWQPLLLRHAERLCACADRRTASEPADAVQDAWLSIARGLGSLDDPRAFGGWAMRIVARRVADRVRQDVRRRRRDRSAARGASPASDADDAETVRLIRLALATLPARDRAVLLLAYGRGMTPGDIAAALGVAPGTAGSRLHRARRRLRAALERLTTDEHDESDR